MNEKIRKILTYIAFPLIFIAGMLVGHRRPQCNDHRAAADKIKDKLSEGAGAAGNAGKTAAKLSDTIGESSDAVRAGKESVTGAVSSAQELGSLIAENAAIISELLGRNGQDNSTPGKSNNDAEGRHNQPVSSGSGNAFAGTASLGENHDRR